MVGCFVGLSRVYQAFRWWGIRTINDGVQVHVASLSGIPMVGYQNPDLTGFGSLAEFIRHSDGGVSEPGQRTGRRDVGVYQAFRWWGIRTQGLRKMWSRSSLSGIPMVGYQNP